MHSSISSKSNKDNKILDIFIDSESFDSDLSETPEQSVLSLLSYFSSKTVRFIRSPFNTSHKNLRKINSFKKILDEKSEKIKSIQIANNSNPFDEKLNTRISFPYSAEIIEDFGKQIFRKEILNQCQIESMLSVFFHVNFINLKFYKGESIFVTNNTALLRNRVWLQSHLSSLLDLLTVEEAMEIMDLFAKSQGEYYTIPHSTLDKEGWYWFSFRSMIPHYNVPHRGAFETRHILEAFASRLTYLLLSIDETGIQYFFPKDIGIMIPYHFNYFIILVTGVFDNLAIATRNKYGLNSKLNKYPSKISLYIPSGKDFLKEIRKYNLDLKSHIDHFREFINLIYESREISVHRQGFKSIYYKHGKTFTNFLEINQNISKMIKRCGDKTNYESRISNWGIFNSDSMFVLLEPYHFARAAGLKLGEFSDKYLELLGFDKFIDTLSPNPNDSYLVDMKIFEQNSLGRRINN